MQKASYPQYRATEAQLKEEESSDSGQHLLPKPIIGMIPGFPTGAVINPDTPGQNFAAVRAVDREIWKLEIIMHKKDVADLPAFEQSHKLMMAERRKKTGSMLKRLENLRIILLEWVRKNLPSSEEKLVAVAIEGIHSAWKNFAWRYEFAARREMLVYMEFALSTSIGSPSCQMDYPGIPLDIWVQPVEGYGSVSATCLQQPRRILIECLRSGLEFSASEESIIGLFASVLLSRSDYKYCMKRIDTRMPGTKKRVEEHLSENVTFAEFRDPDTHCSSPSRGLLILGCDLLRTTRFRTWSRLSYLMSRYVEAWEGEIAITPLKYYAGFSHDSTIANHEKRLFTGTRGLLRSLCEQLIVHSMKPNLEFIETLHDEDFEPLRNGEIEALCRLFGTL